MNQLFKQQELFHFADDRILLNNRQLITISGWYTLNDLTKNQVKNFKLFESQKYYNIQKVILLQYIYIYIYSAGHN